MGMCWHPNPTRNTKSMNSNKSQSVYETIAHCHCCWEIRNYLWVSLPLLSCWPVALLDSNRDAQHCVLKPCLQSLRLQLPSVQFLEIRLIINSTWLFPVRSRWAMGAPVLKRCSPTVSKCFTACKIQRNEMGSKPWTVMTYRLRMIQSVFHNESLWGWLHLIFLLLTFEKCWPWPPSKVIVLAHPHGPSFSKTNADSETA